MSRLSLQLGRGTAMSPSAKDPARVAPPGIAEKAACRILATPRKEVWPKARRTKLEITPRA